MKYSRYQDSFDIQSQKHIFGLWLRKALHKVNRIHRWLRFLKVHVGLYSRVQSTLALRTPRYNGHPDNTDRS